jgi:MraZ protein
MAASHLADLRDRAERRRLAEEDRGEDARGHYHRMRRTFGLSERMPRGDNSIRIPAAMRHLGRIDDLALFVGAGDSFEIWNPDLAMQSDDEHVPRTCRVPAAHAPHQDDWSALR